ncbi:glycosyltransferase [Paenarthrobacter sp. NPDC091711]|uniref:glycosyltransferase n=1 Tax=Paenarthrobacter sp. NPDC091711 TaxID=3364385 RepID=UPI0038222986
MHPNVAAVVVHHRSYETVTESVDRLLSEGINAENLIVVDNSEEPERRHDLEASLPANVVVLFVENKGYGAAVNTGLDYFAGSARPVPDFFLVATHETNPRPGAVGELLTAMVDPRVAVAGPTLVSGNESEFVWSAGGYMSAVTRVPSHYHHRASLQVLHGAEVPEERDWLDGAFLLYRWKDIIEHRVDESFFLYMEETDLHLRLAKAGHRILWVPQARVWQDSNGIPPYFLARNLRLLFKRHESPLHLLAVVPAVVTKRVLGDVVKRRTLSTVLPSAKGLLATLPETGNTSNQRSLMVLNPLGAALKHYETEVLSVVGDTGRLCATHTILEPSASGKSPFSWLFNYIRALVSVRKSSKFQELLVLWPVLGYWDIVIFRLLGIRRARLIMHDPRPLVKARGYSRVARFLASKLKGSTVLVAQSPRAARVLESDAPQLPVELLPHPMLVPIPEANTERRAVPLIRVLGQYKRDRDLQALRVIGIDLGGSAQLQIQGRGWPAVEGWDVIEGFVPEDQLVTMFAKSDALVIPYKNFYQSGIAIRALEAGVPFVGPRDSVLADVLGSESRLLVSDDNPSLWTEALQFAVTDEGKAEAERAAFRWRELSVTAWSKLFGES